MLRLVGGGVNCHPHYFTLQITLLSSVDIRIFCLVRMCGTCRPHYFTMRLILFEMEVCALCLARKCVTCLPHYLALHVIFTLNGRIGRFTG